MECHLEPVPAESRLSKTHPCLKSFYPGGKINLTNVSAVKTDSQDSALRQRQKAEVSVICISKLGEVDILAGEDQYPLYRSLKSLKNMNEQMLVGIRDD